MASQHSVLVVDDHPMLRRLLAAAIDRDGRFRLAGEACDGLEAIDRVTELRPDAVILDAQMPRMGGLDALPGILAARPGAVVVLFSAELSPAVTVAALDRGAAAVHSKGEPLDDLLEDLSRLCQGTALATSPV